MVHQNVTQTAGVRPKLGGVGTPVIDRRRYGPTQLVRLGVLHLYHLPPTFGG
tara:strand:- start:1864 stop:2019 length:156 start_codon:yes stop_codon:yes gene_type:complete